LARHGQALRWNGVVRPWRSTMTAGVRGREATEPKPTTLDQGHPQAAIKEGAARAIPSVERPALAAKELRTP